MLAQVGEHGLDVDAGHAEDPGRRLHDAVALAAEDESGARPRGNVAIASKRPVWWPMPVMSAITHFPEDFQQRGPMSVAAE